MVGPAGRADAGRVGEVRQCRIVKREPRLQCGDLRVRRRVTVGKRHVRHRAAVMAGLGIVRQVDIQKADGPGRSGRIRVNAAHHIGRLFDRPRLCARSDHRAVIAPGDGDRNGRGGGAVGLAFIVIKSDGVRERDLLASGQVVEGAVDRGKVPPQRSELSVDCLGNRVDGNSVVDQRDIEPCCHSGRACKRCIGAVTDIVPVRVIKQHGAVVCFQRIRSGLVAVLAPGRSGWKQDFRAIIRAGDRDWHLLGCHAAIAIREFHRVGQRHRLPLGQVVKCQVGYGEGIVYRAIAGPGGLCNSVDCQESAQNAVRQGDSQNGQSIGLPERMTAPTTLALCPVSDRSTSVNVS